MPECADCLYARATDKRQRKRNERKGCLTPGCDNFRYSQRLVVRKAMKGVAGGKR